MKKRSCRSAFNLNLFIIIFLTASTPRFALAAACCGGGFAAPSVIVGDDKAMLTGAYLQSSIKRDVYADGMWNKRNFSEMSETFRAEGAHIFRDRWQAGFSLPVIKRSRQGKSAAGFGDIAGTLGYEYLPDWDYNPWRPKGLGFLQITAPTGRSVYEADGPFQLDTRGRGFWAIGAGTLLTKTLGPWDVYANLDVHRSFAKTYANQIAKGSLHPGWGGNLGLGFGFNKAAWRFGGGLAWTYEDPIVVRGSSESDGSSERYATASAMVSYMYSDEWAATINYSDQTLMGNPVNTRLGQSIMFQIQRRWAR